MYPYWITIQVNLERTHSRSVVASFTYNALKWVLLCDCTLKKSEGKINELINYIDQLHEIMVTYKNTHQIIIRGIFASQRLRFGSPFPPERRETRIVTLGQRRCIGGDFNEDIVNGKNYHRKHSIELFMLEHDLIASDLGATFIHNSGHDSTSIDFILYQNLYDNIIHLEKLDITGNVSDHYPLILTILHTCNRTVQTRTVSDPPLAIL